MSKHDYKDAKARKLAKQRSEFCEFCGSNDRVTTQHMVKRDELSVRWDPRNLVRLCHEHHDHNNERMMWREFRKVRFEDCSYLLELFPLNMRWFDYYYITTQALVDRDVPKGYRLFIEEFRSLGGMVALRADESDSDRWGEEVLVYSGEITNEVNDAKECSLPQSPSRRSA